MLKQFTKVALATAFLVVSAAALADGAPNGWTPRPDGGWEKYTSAGKIICDAGAWTCRLVQDV